MEFILAIISALLSPLSIQRPAKHRATARHRILAA